MFGPKLTFAGDDPFLQDDVAVERRLSGCHDREGLLGTFVELETLQLVEVDLCPFSGVANLLVL